MIEWIEVNEPMVRMSAFIGIFLVVAVWELLSQCRALTQPKFKRWLNNLVLLVVDVAVVRIVFPAAVVGVGFYAQTHHLGLFNLIDVPVWIAILGSVLILDFSIYLQHVLVHAVPMLWRFHRMHHADLDFDLTTGIRFHPVEIVLSMLIKFMLVILLGPPLVAIIIFEVILNITSVFNHGNIRLPAGFDKVLRVFLVTPDMHRVHHSVAANETNSNFGFNLPWWDYLLGTYVAQPSAGHQAMIIGISSFRDERSCVTLPGMLISPMINKGDDYSIGRRHWEGDK